MNKLNMLYTSIKQSFMIKPLAVIAYFVVMIVSTVALFFPVNHLAFVIEDELLYSLYKYEDLMPDEMRSIYASMEGIKQFGSDLDSFDDDIVDSGSMARFLFYVGVEDVPVYKNGVELDEVAFSCLAFPIKNSSFTREQVENGEPVVAMNGVTLELNKLQVGDKIEFFGREFTVIRYIGVETMLSRGSFYIPYTVDLPGYKYDDRYLYKDIWPIADESIEDGYCYGGELDLSLGKRQLREHEKEILKGYGFKRVLNDDAAGGIIFWLAEVIALMLVVAVILLSVLQYMKRSYARKICLYKVVGMSPFMVFAVMFVEVTLLALSGVGIGRFIIACLQWIFPYASMPIKNLDWLNQLLVAGVPLLVTLIVTVINIIKIARTNPIESRYTR